MVHFSLVIQTDCKWWASTWGLSCLCRHSWSAWLQHQGHKKAPEGSSGQVMQNGHVLPSKYCEKTTDFKQFLWNWNVLWTTLYCVIQIAFSNVCRPKPHLYKNDHTYPGANKTDVPVVILYAEIGTKKFSSFHKVLSEKAGEGTLVYVLRHFVAVSEIALRWSPLVRGFYRNHDLMSLYLNKSSCYPCAAYRFLQSCFKASTLQLPIYSKLSAYVLICQLSPL